jgi:hypothetical protein
LPVILRTNFAGGALEENRIKTKATRSMPAKTHGDRALVVAAIVER